jgi:hypothetical protein
MTGNVSPLYAPATVLGRAGVVFGHDMTSEAALTKLSYLLALPDLSYDEVVRRMSISLRGELTSQAKTLFQHPNGQLSPKLTVFAALGYAIANGDLIVVKELMRPEKDWVLNERDYSGNTPMACYPLKTIYILTKKLGLTFPSSILPQLAPMWRSCMSFLHTELQSISEIGPVIRHSS